MITDTERRDVISSTDVGSILGVGFQTPEEVVLTKLGILAPKEDCLLFRAGKHLESLIDAEYQARRGVTTTGDGNTTYTHPDYPWLVATPDRLVEPYGGAEFKTVSPWKAGEWAQEFEEPRIPDGYFWQITVCMAVMDRNWWDVAGLIGLDELRIYRFHRDYELELQLIEFLKDFRERYILAGQIPEDYASPTWAKHFILLNPPVLDEEKAPTAPEQDEIMRRLHRIGVSEKKLSTAKQVERNRLLKTMLDARTSKITGEFGSATISKKGVLTFKGKDE